MRWIHISDLHFDPLSDGRCTEQLRESLPFYIAKHHITADHLFLTGDYRNAKYDRKDKKELARACVDFILDIAKAAKIDTANIHVIPGNHDLERTGDTERISAIKKSYDVKNGRIDEKDLAFLLERFDFFRYLYCELEDRGIKTVWSERPPRLHPYACFDKFSVLYLNTCIICNSDADRHDLIIGNDDLYRSLEELKGKSPDKPIIVLAHHAMEYLRDDEKKIVEQLFSEYPVCLYLCGDAHELWGRRINNHLEITMGCMVENHWSKAAFSVGEMSGGTTIVEAYRWEEDGSDPDWTPHIRFNKKFGRNGARVITKLNTVFPDANFLGRIAKIDEIENALSDGDRMVLLYGMGGIGKTEICRHIFESYLKETNTVKNLGWITYQDTLKGSFWKQFPVLNTVEKGQTSGQDALADRENVQDLNKEEEYWNAAKELLNGLGGELLLIIDNANEITQQEILLLEQLNCRLLLTARSALDRATCIEVGQLNWEDCRELYRAHSGDTSASDKVIEDIIALAARHTLLIELLAKLQYATGQTAEALYQRLREKGFDLSDIQENISYLHNPEMNQEKGCDRLFIEHVEMLFDISGICAKREEMEILQFFSLSVASCPVPMRTVQKWMGLPNLNHMNALIKAGWLNRGNRNGVPTVEMHPLVSAAVCRMAKPEEERVKVWIKNMADDIKIKYDETAADKAEIISFARAIISNLHLYNMEYLELLGGDADIYLHSGEYGKALELYEQALEMESKIFGEKHLYIAKTYNAIGAVYDGMCEYGEALTWFRRGCEMMEELLGSSHTDTAVSYCNVATTYLKQRKYNEMNSWLERALAIQEAWPDKEHSVNTAIIYTTKGLACAMAFQVNEAIGWYEKAFKIQEDVSGKDHPSAMMICGNIAMIYHAQGKLAEALEIYCKECEVYERRLGEEHPNTTAIYRNIGNVYKSMGRYHDALASYEKALRIREKILGKEHRSTAILYNDIGMLYYERGNISEALPYFMRALQIYEKILGVTDQNTRNVYRNLAITYWRCGRFLKAWEYWKKYRGSF